MSLPWNQERIKRNIPVFENMPAAYKHLLKVEARQKPASVLFRNEILKRQKISNYMNEYDRLAGEIDSYANAFSGYGSSHAIGRLKNRQNELKQLFKEAHEDSKHPIKH
jgi:hypothetical protein